MSWEELLQFWDFHSSWKVFHQDHSCTPRGCCLHSGERSHAENNLSQSSWIRVAVNCLQFSSKEYIGLYIKRTWLKESRLTLLSSRNCRVSWTIWVSPRAILTATLPFDSCRAWQTHINTPYIYRLFSIHDGCTYWWGCIKGQTQNSLIHWNHMCSVWVPQQQVICKELFQCRSLYITWTEISVFYRSMQCTSVTCTERSNTY